MNTAVADRTEVNEDRIIGQRRRQSTGTVSVRRPKPEAKSTDAAGPAIKPVPRSQQASDQHVRKVGPRPAAERIRFRSRMRASARSLLGTLLLRLREAEASATPSALSTPVRPEPSARLQQDRRAFPRYDSQCLVSVVPVTDDRVVSVAERDWRLHSSQLKGPLIDISMNGIAFVSSHSLEEGQHVLLRLSNPRLDKYVDTTAEVLHASQEATGGWKTICQFRRKLTWEQVHALGKHLFQCGVV